jgi:site-specific recombinase XerD
MNTASISTINVKSDKWAIKHKSTYGKSVHFDFSFIQNPWFKKTIKKITIQSMTIGKPKLETLYRYNYSLKHFFEFLSRHSIQLKTFEDLTHQYTQMFVFYLLQQNMGNSTRNVIMSSLKWVVLHGQYFEEEGFPKNQVFDGEEYQALKVDDYLRTKYIPDEVIVQIEKALKSEKNLLLKSLLEIGIDTGIRLSEALELQVECITDDFTGKPVLFVNSPKNKTERFIPVSQRVKLATLLLNSLSKEGRTSTNSTLLATYWLPVAKRFDQLTQQQFRYWLAAFVKNHNILGIDSELYPLTYHAFRHTIGTDMLNKGMSIFEIQEYLGHESLHSTAGYAKVKNPRIQKEYKKLGFIGLAVKELNKQSLGTGKFDGATLKAAALPDGACRKPINNEGSICAKFNMCIICPKFVTTPDHLPVHKNHLERLRTDKETYMTTEYIGTQNHLETIEFALETIIERLEELQHG